MTSFGGLPADTRSPLEVYVNGVPQKLGDDYQVRDGVLCFGRRLAKDTISKKRWLIGAFGVGTYRQNDSVDVRYEGDELRVSVPYGADTLGTVTLTGDGPYLVQTRPKAFAAEEVGGVASVAAVHATIDEHALRAQIVSTVEQAAEGPNLEEAGVIVSAGRGLGKPENYQLIQQLAAALGGSPGATRALVDAGWGPYRHRGGPTGRPVTPRVDGACRLRGAAPPRGGHEPPARSAHLSRAECNRGDRHPRRRSCG